MDEPDDAADGEGEERTDNRFKEIILETPETDLSGQQTGSMTVSPAQVPGRLGLVRDIRGTTSREKELERTNEQLQQFVGVVSHDLRNPLSVAKGHVDLAREVTEEPDARSYLSEADHALDRMDTLIKDLLTLVRQGDAVRKKELLSLEDAAGEAWSNVDTRNADLILECGTTVRADESRLLQLFENLFRNSVEHGGYDVTVRVGDTEHGFYVEDDGVGLPRDGEDVVLEQGYTTSDGGRGLGLTIVSTVAEAHDWEISVGESEEGGARFEFRWGRDGGG